MLLHNSHAYPQAEACALITLCRKERLKELLFGMVGDAGAAVENLDHDTRAVKLFRRNPPHANQDCTADAGGIRRVGDQIGEDLPQLGREAFDDKTSIEIVQDGDALRIEA